MTTRRLGLLFALLSTSQSAWAGAWARDAGDLYAKVGAGHFSGQANFDDGSATLRSTALELYGEAGLGNGWELDLSARAAHNRTTKAQTTGLQDLEVVGKYEPLSGPSALALLVGTRISLYPRGLDPELGPGGSDLLVGGAWGQGLGAGWVNVDAVHRFRIGAPSSGLRFRAELGAMGNAPIGGAVTAEYQPAFGRSGFQASAAAPVARAFSVGTKAFTAPTKGGWGLTGDASWQPTLFNDGPGYRFGAGIVLER